MARTVLLAAGTHALYGARAGSPGFHTDDGKKGGNFTLHHIMPYRYPFFVGFVFEQLIRTFPAWSAVKGGGGKELKRRMLSVYNRLSPHQVADEAALYALNGAGDRAPNLRVGHHFAWMGANLFVGPSGSWRMDDPHEGPEERKPASFDAGRWNTLMSLLRFIDTYAYEFDDVAKTVTTVELVLEEGGFVSGLLEKLEALTGHGRDAHPFTITDWIVLDSDHLAWNIAQRKLSEFLGANRAATPDDVTIKSAKKVFAEIIEKDQAKPADERVVLEMAPVDYAKVEFGGVLAPTNWGVLWRLRRDGEAIPKLKLKGNFQLQ